MSFGFSVGDVITLLNLFERVAVEVRNYRDAPRHFQQLGAELQLLRTTLQRLLHVQPGNEEEKTQLEHIRAIAMHCQQPLLAFINKMRPSETSLGPSRSVNTFGNIGRRLHWSLITRNDVDELRKVIMSEMTAINMLLGLQQITSLKRLRLRVNQNFNQELKKFHAKSSSFITDSKTLFEKLEKLPEDVTSLQSLMARHHTKQEKLLTNANAEIQAVSSDSKTLIRQGKTLIDATKSLRDQVSQSMDTLMMIATDIRKILSWLKEYSKIFSDKVAANGKMLLDIHAMMKRLVRAVEAIPLHLTLAVVRLDDALGESWALPFQACQSIEQFNQILKTVVFGGNRPGAAHVGHHRFIVRCVKKGIVLRKENWEEFVKQGAHLSQAVVLYETKVSVRKCPFAGCNGSLQEEGNVCSACGKESSFQTATTTRIQIDSLSNTPRGQPSLGRSRSRPVFESIDYLSFDLDMKEFRNIHFIEKRESAVESYSEAVSILEREPHDPSALQYLGWWHLCDPSGDFNVAASYLTRAVESDPDCMVSHYLLGRVFLDDRDPQLYRAHEAFQRAIYRARGLSDIWISVGLLFFYVHQKLECLEALTISIRLNPYQVIAWRNLGFLYDSVDQHRDASDAYTRALDLGLLDEECLGRRNALQRFLESGTPVPPLKLVMKDMDLRYATYDVYETGEQHNVDLPGLRSPRKSERSDNNMGNNKSHKKVPEDPDDDWEDYESDGKSSDDYEDQDQGSNYVLPTDDVETSLGDVKD